MADNKRGGLVIKRGRGRREDEPVHGAWKIALADLMTVLFAFTLIMWITSTTSEEQREVIQEYFNPTSVSRGESGADGLMGGRALIDDGALIGTGADNDSGAPFASPPSASPSTDWEADISLGTSATGAGQMGQMNDPGQADELRSEANRLLNMSTGDLTPEQQLQAEVTWRLENEAFGEMSDEEVEAALSQFVSRMQRTAQENADFAEAAEEIVEALSEEPALAEMLDQITMTITQQGLVVEVIDGADYSMFEVGSDALRPRARALVETIARSFVGLEQAVAIAGHTDGRQYAEGASYTNWELSADRANAARRVAQEVGLPVERLERVEGKADSDHLFPQAPLDERNRRISFTLIREAPLPGQPSPDR